MSCKERWVDVFVTRSDDDVTTRNNVTAIGNQYNFDDEFCCSVQSIEIHHHHENYAYITERESDWILPTWTIESDDSDAKESIYNSIQVGDLVRIGNLSSSGFTDYLTVLEVKEVDAILNATSSPLNISREWDVNYGNVTNVLPQATSTNVVIHTLEKKGIAHIALRVNANLNCTVLPNNAYVHDDDTAILRQHIEGTGAPTPVTLANRSKARVYLTSSARAYPYEHGDHIFGSYNDHGSENMFYPLYKAKNWSSNSTLVARLDRGVKEVAAVKLCGYSMVNKRQVGIQHAHEMQSDDFLILRIKEVEGHVISNNRFADGAFAILRAGNTSDNIVRAVEFSSYEPGGIICVPITTSNRSIRNLTIEVTDRLGKPAHIGRLHLWLKLLVTHG
jgi:hypothetical protein